jgi:hypothetical protein
MVTNAAARGGGGGSNSNRNNGGGGRPGNPNNPYKDHQCQVRGKLGHTTLCCWKRFDKNYNRSDKVANAVSTSYNLDPAWYANNATTDHITGDLDKLTMWENYGGNDQVHTANGSGMTIKYVGHSVVSTPHRRILLKNVLHVPQVTRNLASVHRLTADNDIFLKLHPHLFFLSRIGPRGKPFCTGHVKMGFTPFLLWTPRLTSSVSMSPNLLRSNHSRLGHPSFKIVSCVLRDHELPFVSNKNVTHVCDACQQGKSHQLPFPKSLSVSEAHLELIFSDV